MTGFLVGNAFGTFDSKKPINKVFNTDFIGIPRGPSSGTFKALLKGLPNVPVIGNSFDWAIAKDCSIDGDGSKGKCGVIAYDDGSRVALFDGGQVNDLFKWSSGSSTGDEQINLYSNDAFHYKPNPKVTAKFRVKYVTNSRPTSSYPNAPPKAYNYVVNIKKDATMGNESLPTACNSSSNTCFSNYVRDDAGGYAQFDVLLDGANGDYMSIDMNKKASDIANSKFVTSCGTWKRVNTPGADSPHPKGIVRVQISLLSLTWNIVEGCIDPQADWTTPNATVGDGATPLTGDSCTYTTTPITSFTTNESELRVGETAILNWVLSNGKFDEVQIIHDGSNIMEDDAEWDNKKISQSQSIEVSPSTTGNMNYELKVLWNKPNAETPTEDITINVQSAISYVPCPDPNRPTDNNGECAAGCNSGFYADWTTGLCTQCGMDDPAQSENRNVGTDGRCGDCESGYALDANDHCVKSGCMDEDDYEYDPDAVIDDPSACEGFTGETDIDCELSDWSDWSQWSDPDTESGTRTRTRTVVTAASGNGAVCDSIEEIETGVLDSDTGEVIITTMSVTVPPPADDETETGSLVVPIVIGVAVLGALFMLMRR